jgi:hypothetical protein
MCSIRAKARLRKKAKKALLQQRLLALNNSSCQKGWLVDAGRLPFRMSSLVPFPPTDGLTAAQLLFAFCIGHVLADFPLQGEYLATGKNKYLLQRLQDPARPVGIWFFCMAAHCLIHAGVVWAITGSVIFAAAELVLHWTIDAAKCHGSTTFQQDQLLHYGCKLTYVGLAWGGVGV